MLRIISSKLAQRTPGDLSVPHSNQDVLQPYTTMKNFIGREWQKRKREKARNKMDNRFRNFSRYEHTRNPANTDAKGNNTCPVCRNYYGINEGGKVFCPTPECNMARPRFSV